MASDAQNNCPVTGYVHAYLTFALKDLSLTKGNNPAWLSNEAGGLQRRICQCTVPTLFGRYEGHWFYEVQYIGKVPTWSLSTKVCTGMYLTGRQSVGRSPPHRQSSSIMVGHGKYTITRRPCTHTHREAQGSARECHSSPRQCSPCPVMPLRSVSDPTWGRCG